MTESITYEKYKATLRLQNHPQPIKVDLGNNAKESEEEWQNLSFYKSLQRSRGFNISDIVEVGPYEVMSVEQAFFMRMYLKYEVPYFKTYDLSTINGICKALELKKFNSNEVLFTLGEPAESLYVLIEGKLEIFADSQMTESVTKLNPASIVGERAFLNNLKTRTKSCKAIEPSKCLVLDKESFFTKI